MDGGSGINIIFTKTLEEMFIPTSILKTSSTTFQGIVPGKVVYPLGKIILEVVFGNESNFRKETLDFEVQRLLSGVAFVPEDDLKADFVEGVDCFAGYGAMKGGA